MPKSDQQLILELRAEVAAFNKSILDAAKKTETFQKKTVTAFNKVQKKSKQTGDSLFNFSSVAKGVFAALSVKAFFNFADEIQLADNQLKNVTTSTEQYNFVSMELNRIAGETRQGLSELTSVYARFSRAGQDAGFTQQEILDLTESLTKAFKIEGNTTAEVNSTLLQLTQSFRKGIIDGEEYKAVSESSTLVLRAMANQMGVTIGELKELASQGLVTARVLVDGMQDYKQEVDKQFGGLAVTWGELGTASGNTLIAAFEAATEKDAWNKLKRNMLGGLNALTDTFRGVNDVVFSTRDAMDTLGNEATTNITKIAKQMGKLKVAIKNSTDPKELKGLKFQYQALLDITKEIGKENAGTTLGIQNNWRAVTSSLVEAVTEAERVKIALANAEAEKEEKPKKKESLVDFDSGEESLIEQSQRRLTIIGDQAEAERQLLIAADDQIISDKEASAILSNQKELDRFDEMFASKLDRLGVEQATFDEIKAQAAELGIEKLTEDEQLLLALEQSFSDARVSIIETQEEKIKRIKEAAKNHDLQQTVKAGARLLGAMSSAADKGTKIQEGAARLSIIANTAAGMMKQYADLPYPAAVATKIAVFAEGVAALRAVGGGGGSIPESGGGAGGGDTTTREEQQSAAPTETTITDITGGEQITQRLEIVISDESGNTFIDTIGTQIDQAKSDGRI